MKHTSDIFNKHNIKHGFFDTKGGFSKGDFTSLNISMQVGDLEDNVIKNRQKISSNFSNNYDDFIIANQVHSNKVAVIKNKSDIVNIKSQEVDAIITNIPNLILTVSTADCIPILMYDLENNLAGAIHAGWKGAISGIIENSINAMQGLGEHPSNIIACIGPCLHQKNFEVTMEFYEEFINKSINNQRYFIKKNNYKYLFNLIEFAYDIIKKSDIEIVDIINLDTYDINNHFFSHRRSTHNKTRRGTQASCIQI